MILRWLGIGELGFRTAMVVVIPTREAMRSESARGLAQSRTLARGLEAAGERAASWSAVALHRFVGRTKVRETFALPMGQQAQAALVFGNRGFCSVTLALMVKASRHAERKRQRAGAVQDADARFGCGGVNAKRLGVRWPSTAFHRYTCRVVVQRRRE